MRHRFILTHQFRDVVLVIALIEVVILATTGWQSNNTVEWLKLTCKHSGRLSLLLFAVVFLAGPGGGNLVTRYLIRPYHAFAWAHGIHLVEVFAYLLSAGITLHPTRAVGGALAYAMVFALPFLDNKMKGGRLSPAHFHVAEYIYHYYVWLIFFLTYLTRVLGLVPQAGGSYSEHVIGLGVVALIMGSRLVTVIMKRATRKL